MTTTVPLSKFSSPAASIHSSGEPSTGAFSTEISNAIDEVFPDIYQSLRILPEQRPSDVQARMVALINELAGVEAELGYGGLTHARADQLKSIRGSLRQALVGQDRILLHAEANPGGGLILGVVTAPVGVLVALVGGGLAMASSLVRTSCQYLSRESPNPDEDTQPAVSDLIMVCRDPRNARALASYAGIPLRILRRRLQTSDAERFLLEDLKLSLSRG